MKKILYENKVPFEIGHPEFNIDGLDYYEVTGQDLSEQSVFWSYINYFGSDLFTDESCLEEFSGLQNLKKVFFENKSQHNDAGQYDIELFTYNIFNKNRVETLLGFDLDLFKPIQIDFENKKFAHMYFPISKLITVPNNKKDTDEVKKWIPTNLKYVYYILVSKYDFINRTYVTDEFGRRRAWLCKQPNKPTNNRFKLQTPAERNKMLNFILS